MKCLSTENYCDNHIITVILFQDSNTTGVVIPDPMSDSPGRCGPSGGADMEEVKATVRQCSLWMEGVMLSVTGEYKSRVISKQMGQIQSTKFIG